MEILKELNEKIILYTEEIKFLESITQKIQSENGMNGFELRDIIEKRGKKNNHPLYLCTIKWKCEYLRNQTILPKPTGISVWRSLYKQHQCSARINDTLKDLINEHKREIEWLNYKLTKVGDNE